MKRSTRARCASIVALVGILAFSVACTARQPMAPRPEPDLAGLPQNSPEDVVATSDASPEPQSGPGPLDDPNAIDDADIPDVSAKSDADADEKKAQRGGIGASIKARAEAGVEGLIIGTVVGGQVGSTYGAAIGATLFGLYGFITGDVPFESGNRNRQGRRGGEDADVAMEREIEKELERQEALEAEIEDELKRQEELLAAISKQEEINTVREEVQDCSQTESQDLLSPPAPPCEREIPDSIFDKTVRKDGRKERVVKTLDADRDGRPEIEIVHDGKTGRVISRAEDTDYDGVLDAHNSYDDEGKIASTQEDTNNDGVPDRWVDYENGSGTRMEVDRDFDGKRDGFYTYANGTVQFEEHDTNGDGKIDRRVDFEGRRRVTERSDADYDGRMDSTTYFDARGVPTRNERDTNGDGKTDLWEHYESKDPSKLVLARKEEDVNHDGDIDITSHYKKGKLSRKDIVNPDAVK